jgi:hypothetical protein
VFAQFKLFFVFIQAIVRLPPFSRISLCFDFKILLFLLASSRIALRKSETQAENFPPRLKLLCWRQQQLTYGAGDWEWENEKKTKLLKLINTAIIQKAAYSEKHKRIGGGGGRKMTSCVGIN